MLASRLDADDCCRVKEFEEHLLNTTGSAYAFDSLWGRVQTSVGAHKALSCFLADVMVSSTCIWHNFYVRVYIRHTPVAITIDQICGVVVFPPRLHRVWCVPPCCHRSGQRHLEGGGAVGWGGIERPGMVSNDLNISRPRIFSPGVSSQMALCHMPYALTT